MRLRLSAFLGLALLASAPIAHADPNALWNIVHGKCVVNTAPCVSVNKAEHYAVLKDQRGVAQHLLIPTQRITGIEDRRLLDPATPNFFADAWKEKQAVDSRLPRRMTRDELSLAVNAKSARTQNQLHIHIDCLSIEAHNALAKVVDQVKPQWAPLPVEIAGHHFMAKRVMGRKLRSYNPFIDLAKTLKDPAMEMAQHNLDVVGVYFKEGPGFVVLTDVAFPTIKGMAGGEDIQDHDCTINKRS